MILLDKTIKDDSCFVQFAARYDESYLTFNKSIKTGVLDIIFIETPGFCYFDIFAPEDLKVAKTFVEEYLRMEKDFLFGTVYPEEGDCSFSDDFPEELRVLFEKYFEY